MAIKTTLRMWQGADVTITATFPAGTSLAGLAFQFAMSQGPIEGPLAFPVIACTTGSYLGLPAVFTTIPSASLADLPAGVNAYTFQIRCVTLGSQDVVAFGPVSMGIAIVPIAV